MRGRHESPLERRSTTEDWDVRGLDGELGVGETSKMAVQINNQDVEWGLSARPDLWTGGGEVHKGSTSTTTYGQAGVSPAWCKRSRKKKQRSGTSASVPRKGARRLNNLIWNRQGLHEALALQSESLLAGGEGESTGAGVSSRMGGVWLGKKT